MRCSWSSAAFRPALALVTAAALLQGAQARAEERSFEAGSLILPMDLAYQDKGLFQSYGLVFQLLRQQVPVSWVIRPGKLWHAQACDTVGDECSWDCAGSGSGPCSYPTAEPDFFASAVVVWDDQEQAQPGDAIDAHGYRAGPFVIAAADAAAALPIIEAWNDSSLWGDNPWADRSIAGTVTVHEASAAFDANVAKQMVAAPTIAVFSDGNEDIATGYLRAAGIRQSNGNEFPAAKCGECGRGTPNPDMLTVESVMGDMGTCEQPNLDHRNGELFTADGEPAFCQIMSMHWNVDDREKVECDGGCPDTQAECDGETFTYHGHEVVAEVRQFLNHATHFFAECQAVNAYENTEPNPAWPYLDDEGRMGHFLTTSGSPPTCVDPGDCDNPELDADCVAGGCDGGSRDCCLPSNSKEMGAGFLIGSEPNSSEIKILSPDIAYNQLDGVFETTGGSEPAYNLSEFLQTAYKNDRDITFITGPDGPGKDDVWMTGYLDGACQIVSEERTEQCGSEGTGKVSYLGGHRYDTNTPITGNWGSQGARLFLNALFEADCVTTVGQPQISLSWSGPTPLARGSAGAFTVSYANLGLGSAIDAELVVDVPAAATLEDYEAGGVAASDTVRWTIGSIGAVSGSSGGAASTGSRGLSLSFAADGELDLTARLSYRVGATLLEQSATLHVQIAPDTDGDGVIDSEDCAPGDSARQIEVEGVGVETLCVADDDDDDDDGISDADEIAQGTDPRDADSDNDGVSDGAEVEAGTDPSDGDDGGVGDSGCGCSAGHTGSGTVAVLLLLGLALGWRRKFSRA